MNTVRLQLIVSEDTTGYRQDKPLKHPQDVAAVIRAKIGNEDREHFVVLLMNTKNFVDGFHTISIGTLNMSLVHPREAFKAAIMCNSASVIFGHNHPSGVVTQSQEDIAITERLKNAGEILGIEVLDHVIVGGGNHQYISFKEEGLL